jgi:hypothetical protein
VKGVSVTDAAAATAAAAAHIWLVLSMFHAMTVSVTA